MLGFTQQPDNVLDSLKLQLKTAKGQQKIKTLIEISVFFWDINPDSSIYYAEKSLTEAKADESSNMKQH